MSNQPIPSNELRDVHENLAFELLLLNENDQLRVLSASLQLAQKLTNLPEELRNKVELTSDILVP